MLKFHKFPNMSRQTADTSNIGVSQTKVGEVGFDSIVEDGGGDSGLRVASGNDSHIKVALEGSDIKLVNPLLQSVSQATRGTSESLASVPVKIEAIPLPSFSRELVEEEESEQPQHTTADVERLQLIVSDLSRRLQNAQHTIEAQRDVAKRSAALAERFRRELGEAHNRLRLETAKNVSTLRKKTHAEEAVRYERNKLKATKMHEEVRNAILDRTSQGMKSTSHKIENLKKSVSVLEIEHESQKRLLLHLGEMDKMTEEMANAAQHGDLQACATLIKRGARINEVDSAGYLPLYYAASFGHTACSKLLLEFGTDPSSYLSGHSPIEIAARNGHLACVKLLIRFGADLEDAGLRGVTALNSAVAGGHIEVVIELLNAGADIQGRNMNEDSPLHVATQLENPVPMIRLLLKKGGDVNVVNRQGYNPVRLAIANASALAVDALGGRAGMVPMEDGQLFNGSEHGEGIQDNFSEQRGTRNQRDSVRSGSLDQLSQITFEGSARGQGSSSKAIKDLKKTKEKGNNKK